MDLDGFYLQAAVTQHFWLQEEYAFLGTLISYFEKSISQSTGIDGVHKYINTST